MSTLLPPTSRRAQLQARSALQREQLATQIAELEGRFKGTDNLLGSLRDVVARPGVLLGGAALLLTLRRSGWWSVLSRGVVLFATARRLYGALQKK